MTQSSVPESDSPTEHAATRTIGGRGDGDAPWFVRAFERIYLDLYRHRGDAEAAGHIPLIMEKLHLRVADRVLDVACGGGRHARALARRGIRVTGVDLSEDLLEEARERSPSLPGTPRYLRCDIRELPYASQFEGAISMFTSFGYFREREDDLRVLRGVRRALVAGGRFLIDFLNEPSVRSGLEPFSLEERGRYRVQMDRHIDETAEGGPRVNKRVRVESLQTGLVQADYEESVRLYTPAEIDGLLEDAGLELLGAACGDYDGSPHRDTSPRYIRVAGRPLRG